MGTGRKRIEIQPIHDMSRRRVTLTKRRQGLFKKMDRLRTLTGCKAAAIVFSTAGRPYTFGDLSLLDSFTGSIISSRSDGGSSASYGRKDVSVDGDDHGGFHLGLGASEGVTDLDGFMAEMDSLLEIRRKVVEKLNQQTRMSTEAMMVTSCRRPLSIVEVPPVDDDEVFLS